MTFNFDSQSNVYYSEKYELIMVLNEKKEADDCYWAMVKQANVKHGKLVSVVQCLPFKKHPRKFSFIKLGSY
ncbi:MAG TPA: hypothetical protein VI423_01995 [Paenisporosarcina sp.]|nr:hypothetical protein [Paenisporosarcina sp.]